MATEKERLLLQHLRQNSRKSLTKISRETGIPVSTLFDILKRLETRFIQKHVSLIDFSKLGYGLRINFAMSAKKKKQLKEFLMNHPNINSLFSSINGQDFYAECVFRSLKEFTEFKSGLEQFEMENVQETFVVEELKREGFILS